MNPEDLGKVIAFAQLVLEDDEEADDVGYDESDAGGGCPYVPRRRIGAEYK